MISSGLHIACAILMIWAAFSIGQYLEILNWLHWMGLSVFIGLLIYQHTLVKPGHLEKVNMAFFTTNGVASIIFSLFFIVDLFV